MFYNLDLTRDVFKVLWVESSWCYGTYFLSFSIIYSTSGATLKLLSPNNEVSWIVCAKPSLFFLF